MGELLHIHPKLHFPLLTVFGPVDTFNKERGRYFYRDVKGALRGPFKSKMTASLDLLKTCPTSGAPMRTPFEQDNEWWWKKDDATGVTVMGPYEFEGEAESAILNYVMLLRDEANNEYR